MSQQDDKSDEEFSNWVTTVLGLLKTRDGSIKYISRKMKTFVDELVQLHGADEESHFKELLIKVVVNGEVQNTNSKQCKSKQQWALYDKRCTTCVNVFDRILDNFKDSYRCIRWERHASEETISPSNYWWIVAKLYVSENCEIETSLGPDEVEPLAVFSLMSRCKLFHENLLWFDVGQVIQSRHELMHSNTNCLSKDEKDNYILEMKTLITNVSETATEVLNTFEEVGNLTISLFTEEGEIHQLANKALLLQEECLKADLKPHYGANVTLKSLAVSKMEIKMEKEIKGLKQEISKQDMAMSSYKKKMEDEIRDLKQEGSKQNDEIFSLKSTMKTTVKDLGQVKWTQDKKISSLKDEMKDEIKDLKQDKSKQDSEIFSLKSTIEDEIKDLKHDKSKQNDEIFSLKSTMENEIKGLKQENSKQDKAMSSLKIKIEDEIKDLKHDKSKQSDEIFSLKSTIENEIKGLKQENSKQDMAMSSFKKKIENEIKGLKQENSEQDKAMSSLKIKIEDEIKDLKRDKSKPNNKLFSLKSTMEDEVTDWKEEGRRQFSRLTERELSKLEERIYPSMMSNWSLEQ